jgi:hypothetical protein
MLGQVPELSIAHGDGALPVSLGSGSPPGESGVSVLSARFKGAVHVSGASPRRDHVCFSLSDQLRYRCHIAGRSLSHEPPPGSLAVCIAESGYGADADGTAEAIVVSVDVGRLALAAAEDSEIDAQLIDRFWDYDGQSGLAEIAASTGFADQSHLSRWVRRVRRNLHDNPSSAPQTKGDWSHLVEGTNIERFAPSQEHCRRPHDVRADPAADRLFNASRPETIGY